MSKHLRTEPVAQELVQPEQVIEVPTVASNYTITLKRGDHPQNRSSYVVEGKAGNVVFFNTLFASGIPPTSITLSCEMVSAVAKVDKSEVAAAKAVAKALAAQEKLDKQTAAALAKQAKADSALAAAKARVEQAQAKVAVA